MSDELTPRSFWPTWRSNRLFALLLAILLTYVIVWVAIVVRLTTLRVEQFGRTPQNPPVITVSGQGKVTGVPTTAMATLGLDITNPDVVTSHRLNIERMNRFIEAVKQLGVKAEDMQTSNFSLSPQYRYEPGTGRRFIDGYLVSQSIRVKIRDLSKVGSVLGKAGEEGLNQVSGVDFIIDDPKGMEEEARAKAILEAQSAGAKIASSLGVRLVRVVDFSESVSDPTHLKSYGGYGYGILAESSEPQIETGTLDVVANVQITYEIR
ncbi:SIMPL domain-containing protein [Candidatus Uhrbacteria bacterium]|nr:SIMPL domain-containing protein [Candidatus Uhrbacteria bacterium]